MPGKVRRIVTGVNRAGRSYIVSDQSFPTGELGPGQPVRVGLWTTAAAPVSNEGHEDSVPDGVIMRTAPAARGGTVIRITDIPPDAAHVASAESFAGAAARPRRTGPHAIRASMPRTRSITPSAWRGRCGRSWTRTRPSCGRATCSSSGAPITPGPIAATASAGWPSSSSTRIPSPTTKRGKDRRRSGGQRRPRHVISGGLQLVQPAARRREVGGVGSPR